ncbi:MAG TPA: hypothetical protein VGH28_06030 [Polyangiaceae bacterium]|jgi:hypothetical protein
MKDVRGVVKAFAKETGEGIIVLESGVELPFLAQYVFYSDADMTPASDVVIGDTAKVSITFTSMGKRRAQAVILDRPPPKPMSFTSAFKELRALGFLSAWQLADAKRAVPRLYGEIPKRFTRVHAMDLLADYYGTGPTERGVQDGYLAHDWRFGQETDDIVAEFVRVLGCPPATQIRNDSDGIVVVDAADPSATVTVRRELSELAQFFQTRFDALGISRRLIELETHGDLRVFVVRDAALIQQFRTAGSLEARVL